MKKYIKFLNFIVLCFAVITSNGQQNDTLKIERNKQGIVNFAHFKPNSERKIQDGTKFLKTFLQAKTDDDFRLIEETDDELGFSHLRFQQYYKGVKVENSEYLVHGRNGIIESINGDFKPVTLSSVKPLLNEKQALHKALDYVHAKKYKWEDKAYEKFKKENTNDAAATYYPKGELVIVKDYLTGSEEMKLAWKFTISSLDPDNEQWVYIDATNGETVGDTPLLLNSNTTGNAETLYSGTVGITCDSYSSGYRLYETRTSTSNHSVNIHTWDCQSQSNLTSAVEFSNNNTNWTTGNWSAISQDQSALDAHWAEEKVLDYWSTVHNRNSLNNQGLTITGYVHFYQSNSTAGWPNNAQWDGNNNVMKYGDGDGGTNFYPFVALDVVAHEMGHGVAQYTAGFSSTDHRQECDALNEGFSDIWGACVEDWATSNKQTWLAGEEIFATTSSDCIRNMQNPNSSTAAEGPHPDTYLGDFWDINGEPHTNSTVLSHWFYLLSEGSNSLETNDNNDCFYVSGIGLTDAQKIAFRAETNLNSSATYADARTQTILTASNLFGSTSNQVVQTTNAWYGVGVGDEYEYQVSGPTNLCSSGGEYSVPNAPSGSYVYWSYDTSKITSYYGGNTWTALRAISNGEGWVEAYIPVGCDTIFLPRMTVWAGIPTAYNFYTEVNGEEVEYYDVAQICPNITSCLDAWAEVEEMGETNYTWHLPTWYSTSGSFGANGICFNPNGTIGSYITADVTNSCGTGYGVISITLADNGCEGLYRYAISPNPVSTELTVEQLTIEEAKERAVLQPVEVFNSSGAKDADDGSFTVEIWQEKKGKVMSVDSKSKKEAIDVSKLEKGYYILHIRTKQALYQEHILVK